MSTSQTVRLTHNGPNQVLNIPQEFELSSDEVIVRKVGESLIIEPESAFYISPACDLHRGRGWVPRH